MTLKAWKETVDDKLASLAENGCNCQQEEELGSESNFSSSNSQPEEHFNSTSSEEFCPASSQEIYILPTNLTQPLSLPLSSNFFNSTMATRQTSRFKHIILPKFD